MTKPEAHQDLPRKFRMNFALTLTIRSTGVARSGIHTDSGAKRSMTNGKSSLMRNLHALVKRYWTSSGIC